MSVADWEVTFVFQCFVGLIPLKKITACCSHIYWRKPSVTALQYASIDIQSVCMYIYIYGFQIFAFKQSTIPAKFGYIYLWARLLSFWTFASVARMPSAKRAKKNWSMHCCQRMAKVESFGTYLAYFVGTRWNFCAHTPKKLHMLPDCLAALAKMCKTLQL